jgi:hypothetical protein
MIRHTSGVICAPCEPARLAQLELRPDGRAQSRVPPLHVHGVGRLLARYDDGHLCARARSHSERARRSGEQRERLRSPGPRVSAPVWSRRRARAFRSHRSGARSLSPRRLLAGGGAVRTGERRRYDAALTTALGLRPRAIASKS